MSQYMRVSIQGALPAGEVWSVNPVFAPLMPPFSPDSEDMAAAALAVANVEPGSMLRNIMSSSTTITGARLEARSSSFELDDVAEAFRTTPLPGFGSLTKPLQSSVVLSLRTAGVGARARGRLYWPSLAATLNTTSTRIDSAQTADIAAAAAEYLEAISDAIGSVFTGTDTWGPVVFSRVAGTARQVTGVWVGDILDTQRRRRDTVGENYSRVAYPPV